MTKDSQGKDHQKDKRMGFDKKKYRKEMAKLQKQLNKQLEEKKENAKRV